VTVMLLVFAMSLPVYAQRNGGAVSLDESVQVVRQREGGRVLSAQTRNVAGRPVHHIRILTRNGKVRRFRVDGATGKALGKRR